MYERPAVVFMPQGPEGPWSGPEHSPIWYYWTTSEITGGYRRVVLGL